MMKNNQNGRSMIEMLGVLAIIGILSVGGLAGYAKAMAQYRVNATIQQVQVIASKLSTLGSSGNSYEGLTPYTAYRLGVLPSEIIESVNNKEVTLSNVYAGSINIEGTALDNSETCTSDCDAASAYIITYDNIPQEACMALGGNTWSGTRNTSMIGFGVGPKGSEASIASALNPNCELTTSVSGKTIAAACQNSDIPMGLDVVTDACDCDDGDCVLVLKFF